MNSEEKELLLKDMSARLQYHPLLKVNGCKTECMHHLIGIESGSVRVDHFEYKDGKINYLYIDNWMSLQDVKPYLRPMSSMTEEEIEEFMDIIIPVDNGKSVIEEDKITAYLEFVYKHHLDYRGLIEKNLALPLDEKIYELLKNEKRY